MSNRVRIMALNGASAPEFVPGPAPLGYRTTIALVLLSALVAAAAIKFPLPAFAAVVLAIVFVAGCKVLGPRPFGVFGLIFSVPLYLSHHFVYRPNLGAADGVAVYVVDFWVVWLMVDAMIQRQKGTRKPLRDFAAFLVPVILLLVTDLISFTKSGDLQLSAYGFIEHFRDALLFLVLVSAVRQGKKELNAASLAIVWAVLTIGGICVLEMILQKHLGIHAYQSGEYDPQVFRSAGLTTPTLAAGYLATLMPLVAIEFFFPISKARKRLAGLSLVLGIAGLGCTLSRAAVGILAIGLIPLFMLLRRQRVIRRGHMIVGLLLVALIGAGLSDKITARADEGRIETLDGRTGLLGTALNMAADSPVIGQGLNNYELKMYGFIPSDQRQSFEYLVHNKYLLTLAETGPLGLAALLILLVVGSRRAFLLARRGLPMGTALLCSMIVIALHMNVESYTAGPILLNVWILLALIAGFWSSEQATEQMRPAE
ncbi:MAG TPA: O-antigen ligase family protein [Acidobacteriaceae bacterium]|nr:O-antigen ligase family protein [Acidobacteriaceae bacterium]